MYCVNIQALTVFIHGSNTQYWSTVIHFIAWLCAGAIMFSGIRSLKLCGFVMDLGGIHKSSLMCVLAVQATWLLCTALLSLICTLATLMFMYTRTPTLYVCLEVGRCMKHWLYTLCTGVWWQYMWLGMAISRQRTLTHLHSLLETTLHYVYMYNHTHTHYTYTWLFNCVYRVLWMVCR